MATLTEIERARDSLRGIVHHTPLESSSTLSDLTGGKMWLKLENLQRTGSFKFRGAYNRICQLTGEERARGIIAASAGNHAQGVALSAKLLGIEATIVVPYGAPLSKVEAIKSYGAEVILDGRDYDEAETKALEIQKRTGSTFIHAFNDRAVIAGQGTLGLEILDDLPEVDTVIAGIGGGGLISGVATAIKSIKPGVRIIGVEPAGAAKVTESLKAGNLVTLDKVSTIADGLATRRAGDLTFATIQEMVDEVVTVDDDEISEAILFLMERSKTVAEGAGAASLAALLSRKVSIIGEKAVVILSGGNIDVRLLDNIIERGLIRSGRTLIFSTILPDKPGSLRDLLDSLTNMQANIEVIQHDRTRPDIQISESEVQIKIDTRGLNHVHEILDELTKRNYKILSHWP